MLAIRSQISDLYFNTKLSLQLLKLSLPIPIKTKMIVVLIDQIQITESELIILLDVTSMKTIAGVNQ